MIPNIYRHTTYHLAAYTWSESLHLSLQVHCNTTAHSLTSFIRKHEFSHGEYKPAGAHLQERARTLEEAQVIL